MSACRDYELATLEGIAPTLGKGHFLTSYNTAEGYGTMPASFLYRSSNIRNSDMSHYSHAEELCLTDKNQYYSV